MARGSKQVGVGLGVMGIVIAAGLLVLSLQKAGRGAAAVHLQAAAAPAPHEDEYMSAGKAATRRPDLRSLAQQHAAEAVMKKKEEAALARAQQRVEDEMVKRGIIKGEVGGKRKGGDGGTIDLDLEGEGEDELVVGSDASAKTVDPTAFASVAARSAARFAAKFSAGEEGEDNGDGDGDEGGEGETDEAGDNLDDLDDLEVNALLKKFGGIVKRRTKGAGEEDDEPYRPRLHGQRFAQKLVEDTTPLYMGNQLTCYGAPSVWEPYNPQGYINNLQRAAAAQPRDENLGAGKATKISKYSATKLGMSLFDPVAVDDYVEPSHTPPTKGKKGAKGGGSPRQAPTDFWKKRLRHRRSLLGGGEAGEEGAVGGAAPGTGAGRRSGRRLQMTRGRPAQLNGMCIARECGERSPLGPRPLREEPPRPEASGRRVRQREVLTAQSRHVGAISLSPHPPSPRAPAASSARGRIKDPPPEEAPMGEGERALARCLLSDSGCTGGGEAREKAQAAALNLTGVRFAMGYMPQCFVMTSSGECAKFENNPNSNLPGRLRWRSKLPRDLHSQMWGTCALVANGPLSKVAKNGQVINEHDAVWRFNLMMPASQAAYVGTKTTVRLFNRLRGFEATGGRDGRGANIKGTKDEHWLFWHMNSAAYLDGVRSRFPAVKSTLLHGYAIRWMVEVYFQIRADVMRLTGQRFPCPQNLSSGVQAALLAQKLCGLVDAFGFSYSKEILTTRPGHMDGRHSMHTAHSWDFDVLFIRLLHLAGRLNICTADDPGVSVQDLMKRRGGLSEAARGL